MMCIWKSRAEWTKYINKTLSLNYSDCPKNVANIKYHKVKENIIDLNLIDILLHSELKTFVNFICNL